MIELQWQKRRDEHTGGLYHISSYEDFYCKVVRDKRKATAYYNIGTSPFKKFTRKSVNNCKTDLQYILNNLYGGIAL